MAQQPEKIELSVSNFGPIVKADIDLRPLTVFVGPSNTGKSYLAVLVYALHKSFKDYSWHWLLRQPVRVNTSGRLILDVEIPQGILNAQQENVLKEIVRDSINWIDAVASQDVQSNSSGKFDIPLPESVSTFVRQRLTDMNELDDLVIAEIERCFGIDQAKRLIRHSSRGGSKVDIHRHVTPQHDAIASIKYELRVTRSKPRFTSSISDDIPIYVRGNNSEEIAGVSFDYPLALYKQRLRSDNLDELLKHMNNFIETMSLGVNPYLVGSLKRKVHYLPADRTGIMHAHRVVVGSMIRSSPRSGVQNLPALPTLSGVLADFLEDLIELENRPRTRGFDVERRARHIRSQSLAASLEEKMLLGTIQVENSTIGYPEFYYQPQGWKENIPLMNSSSMVSELAPVVLYLRHIVRPGDAIIIEEPESHLHPAMQVEFIRQLAAVVKSGVQVIITTHSELVLEELGNLMKLSDLPKSQRKGIKGAEYALKYDQVGVWRFEKKDRPKGSVVKEIKLHKEYGTFPSGFSEVAEDTYNDYAEISNRISGASMNG